MIPKFDKPIVYFIQAGETGPVKIGWTQDVKKRMAALRVSHYEQLNLRAVMENATMSDEGRIHAELGACRIRGEWFWPTADVYRLMSRYCWPRPEGHDDSLVPGMELGQRF